MPETTRHPARVPAVAARPSPLRAGLRERYRLQTRPRRLEDMVARLGAQVGHRVRLVAGGASVDLGRLDHAIAVGAVRVAFREPRCPAEEKARADLLHELTWPWPNDALRGDAAVLLSVARPVGPGLATVTSATGTGGPGAPGDGAGSTEGSHDDGGRGRERGAGGLLGEVVFAMTRARRDARELFAHGQALASRVASAHAQAWGARLCCIEAHTKLEAMAKVDALSALLTDLRPGARTASTIVAVAVDLERQRWPTR